MRVPAGGGGARREFGGLLLRRRRRRRRRMAVAGSGGGRHCRLIIFIITSIELASISIALLMQRGDPTACLGTRTQAVTSQS